MVCEKPDYFTKEWYINQKKIHRTDVDLVKELETSIDTMRKWKKEMGIQEDKLKRLCAIPEFFTQKWYDQQKKEGKKDRDIAVDELFVSHYTMTRWKKKKGIVQAK